MNVTGTITLDDGTTSEFSIDVDPQQWGADSSYRQWGAETPRLGRSVDLVESMADGLRDFVADLEGTVTTATEKGIYDLLRERLERMTPAQAAEWIVDTADTEPEGDE